VKPITSSSAPIPAANTKRLKKRIYWLEGWLPPAEFVAMLGVARGHYFLRGKNYTQAEPLFKAVFEQNPCSQFAPEALYYRGVSRYLNSHKVDELNDLHHPNDPNDPKDCS
jgi:hypothetical protein